MTPCLLLALSLALLAGAARRWARAREAEAAERAVARHTLAIYAALRDGRNRLYLPGDRYDDHATGQKG